MEPVDVGQRPYPRFDIGRPCPKCGSGPTPSVFCTTRLVEWGVYVKGHYFDVPEGGHLHRKCLHCGHERVELAMDTPLMAEETRTRVLFDLRAERRRQDEQYRAAMGSHR